MREPREVLLAFGLDLPPEVENAVWDASAENRHMVLPLRPAGSEHLGEQELAGLVEPRRPHRRRSGLSSGDVAAVAARQMSTCLPGSTSRDVSWHGIARMIRSTSISAASLDQLAWLVAERQRLGDRERDAVAESVVGDMGADDR